MYLVILTYVKPLEEIDRLLDRHVAFLTKHYDSGHFVFSGRRNPRIGGVILVNVDTEEKVRTIIAEDPFFQAKAAEYELISFTPTKYDARFACFVENA